MKMTEEGLALIKRFEGFRDKAYLCPAGIWTIGYGHTTKAGPPAVSKGLVMSEAEAHAVLGRDVERFAGEVRGMLRRDLTDQQFSALLSFAYNVGPGALRGSSVLKAVNAGDFDAVPRRLQLWVKAGGKVLPGLVRRRAAEAELFVRSVGVELVVAEAPRPISGTPAHRSSTIIAGFATALAAVLSAALQTQVGWVSIALVAMTLSAAAWIIRERLRKSREDGI